MKFTEWMRNIRVEHVISVFVLSVAFTYLFYVSTSKLPTDKVTLIGDIKMTMLTIVTLIVNFYFGPSRSKKEDKTTTNETDKTNAEGDSGTI
jgi:hypothetical protein